MAVSVSSQTTPFVDKLIVDTDANATGEDSIFSGAAANVYIVDIDNSNNSTAEVYAKLFNNANPTVGGNSSPTEPDVIIPAPKSTRQTVTVGDGINFSSDFSFACTAGAETASNNNPSITVTVRIMAE
tara:strand:- start:660 stop:1043 length:384 start_codon:yes stop_codon:yes gene_type:complete